MLRIGILLALAGSAVAEEAKARRLEVKVDDTVEIAVDNLIGFQCDHPKLIDAKLVTRKDASGERNVFVVKGLEAGTTQCRVGSDVLGASRLFDIVVTPRR